MSTNSRGSVAIELEPGRFVPSWIVLGIVCIGQFMVVLDASIVNVALPSIQRDLHFSTSGLQWIVNAYTLTFAGFLLLGGAPPTCSDGERSSSWVSLSSRCPACSEGWPRTRPGSSAPGHSKDSEPPSWLPPR